ncbi:MAG: helix-turn-helix transcriptional regulator [Pseudomonadota bacterium]
MLVRQQIAGARALLGWTRQNLSERSGVSLRTIARYESGEGDITTMKLAKLEDTLLSEGIRFVNGGVTSEALKRPPL